jgi:hypothetical protein
MGGVLACLVVETAVAAMDSCSVWAHAGTLHAGRRVFTSAVTVEDRFQPIAHATVAMLRSG